MRNLKRYSRYQKCAYRKFARSRTYGFVLKPLKHSRASWHDGVPGEVECFCDLCSITGLVGTLDYTNAKQNPFRCVTPRLLNRSAVILSHIHCRKLHKVGHLRIAREIIFA